MATLAFLVWHYSHPWHANDDAFRALLLLALEGPQYLRIWAHRRGW